MLKESSEGTMPSEPSVGRTLRRGMEIAVLAAILPGRIGLDADAVGAQHVGRREMLDIGIRVLDAAHTTGQRALILSYGSI